MRCRYCNIALAPLRSLANDEFCCDEHRDAFHAQQAAAPNAPEATVEPVVPVTPTKSDLPAALRMLRLKFAPAPPLSIASQPIAQEPEPVWRVAARRKQGERPGAWARWPAAARATN